MGSLVLSAPGLGAPPSLPSWLGSGDRFERAVVEGGAASVEPMTLFHRLQVAALVPPAEIKALLEGATVRFLVDGRSEATAIVVITLGQSRGAQATTHVISLPNIEAENAIRRALGLEARRPSPAGASPAGASLAGASPTERSSPDANRDGESGSELDSRLVEEQELSAWAREQCESLGRCNGRL